MNHANTKFTDCIISIGALIEGCDIIGKSPKLKLRARTNNKTLWGGLLCLAIYLFMFIGFLYFGQEIYYREIPNIIESVMLTDGSDSIKVDSSEFFFMVAIRDLEGKYIKIDDGYVNVKMSLIKYTRESSPIEDENTLQELKTEVTPIQFGECTAESFGENKELGRYLNKANWLCIKENQNISVNGGFSFNTLSKVEVEVTKCDQKSNRNCKNIKEVNDKLNGASFLIKYIDHAFNFRNFENFTSHYLAEENVILNPDQTKLVKFDVMQTETHTDTGYMFEDFSVERYHKKRSYQEQTFALTQYNTTTQYTSNIICDIYFTLSYQKKVYYRKYYKIQNLIAELGGLSKSFVIIALLLNYFHDEAKYYQMLIDQLFDVDDLYKYFQYYNPEEKQMFRKYRDSIILRNTKEINDMKKELDGFNSSTSKLKINNFVTQPKESRLKKEEKYFKINFNEIVSNGSNDRNKIDIFVNKPKEMNDSSKSLDFPSENASINNNNVIARESKVNNLKKNANIKENFFRVKRKKFTLNSWELLQYVICQKKMDSYSKSHIIAGGKEMINTRMDVIHILKKNLEFDRFKNLMLRDHQILLLNSLSKFMLDPERVNLVDFETCNYEKMIDAYGASLECNTMVDRNLCSWVRSKFHFE